MRRLGPVMEEEEEEREEGDDDDDGDECAVGSINVIATLSKMGRNSRRFTYEIINTTKTLSDITA